MRDLSTPSDTSEPVAGQREIRALTTAIPALVAAALTLVVVLDRPPSHQLLVMAPAVGTPGRPLPIRAVVVESAPAAPAAPSPSVAMTARLVDPASGRAMAHAVLVASASIGAEGALPLPSGLRGSLVLEVSAPEDRGRRIVHRRTLPIAADGSAASTRERPETGPTALIAFPVRPVGDAVPPDRLELRVPGGACVPELPCRVLVEVGRPAAQLEIALARGAGRLVPIGGEPRATEGIVEWEARLASVEAAVELVVSREGVEVARREVQLPVELGVPAVRVERALWVAPARPRFSVFALDPSRAFIVDLFRDGRWEQAFSMPAPAETLAMGEPIRAAVPSELGAGVYRVAVRSTPFDRDIVANDIFYVGEEGTPTAELLSSLVRRLATRGEGDAATPREGSDVEATARFLLAPLAAERVEAPPLGAASDGRAEEAWRLRIGVASVILVLGLVAAAILLVRGLEAERRARSLLAEAEAPIAEASAGRRRGRLTVAGAALFVVAVFAGVAWIVLSRGCS